MRDMSEARIVIPDQMVLLELPFSEVCMHMKVAGTKMYGIVLSRAVQLVGMDGRLFSAPILHGEAGIFTNPDGSMYYHPPKQEEVSVTREAIEHEVTIISDHGVERGVVDGNSIRVTDP